MLSFEMEFGHLGFDNFLSSSNNGENGQKCYGFGLQRAVNNNEDEVRDFKMAKTSSLSSSSLFDNSISDPRTGSSDNEAMLRFRYNGSEQMLSFSSPYSHPLNLPYYPHSFGRNNNSGGNMQLQQQQQQQGLKGLFTASQWMELEHQALIYKYITANVPIPSYLLNPIRKAFESAAFRSNALGWGGFQLGFSNSDPEPGRCRRTDGKKWRCSRDAVAEQKYCERHMNRGRHRSRKPVEPQPAAAATTAGNGKLAAVASPSGGVSSHRLPNLQPAPSNHLSGIPTINRSVVDKEDTNGGYQHTPLVSITSPKLGLKDTHFFPHKHQTAASQESSFGLVCSDSLLNPLNSSSSLVNSDDRTKSHHPLRQFMDEWPKTHLSISIPTTDFMSSTSSPTASPRELEMGLSVGRITGDHNPRQTNWVPISWEPSMGGPLGEVLHSSTGECKPLNLIDSWDNSPRLATSPTGVLQRGAFVSLSNSSTASSPRAETGGSINPGLMNPSLPAL